MIRPLDHAEAALVHLEHHDVSYVAVSRAPFPEIESFRQRMGWRVKWLSSYGNDFSLTGHELALATPMLTDYFNGTAPTMSAQESYDYLRMLSLASTYEVNNSELSLHLSDGQVLIFTAA